MTNKIVLAFFFEHNEKEEDVNCNILDEKEKYQIFSVQKNDIYFFYIINIEESKGKDDEIVLNIYSRKSKFQSEKIQLNSNKILFSYSIKLQNYNHLDTKTYYKFNEFLKFIEKENLSQDDIIEFYLCTLKHLKEKKIINSDIIIDLILRVVEYESIFKEAISFFYDLENIVDDNFEDQKRYSDIIEVLKEKNFENELKNKVDIFILYYYNLTNEQKFNEFIEDRENLINSKNPLFKKWTENFINYKIDNFQTEEDISLILSKCKTYNLVFKIISTKKNINDLIKNNLDLSNYSFIITNEINDIIPNYCYIKETFMNKIRFKPDLFIDFIEEYKKEENALELLIEMIKLIGSIKKYQKKESEELDKKLNIEISNIFKKEYEDNKYENKDLISQIKDNICSKPQLKGRITFKFYQFLNLKTISTEEIKEYKDLNLFEFYNNYDSDNNNLNEFCDKINLKEFSNFISIIDENYLKINKELFKVKLINYIEKEEKENKDLENFKNNLEFIEKIFIVFSENNLSLEILEILDEKIKIRINCIIFNYLLKKELNKESSDFISQCLVKNNFINENNVEELLNSPNKKSIIENLVNSEYRLSIDNFLEEKQNFPIKLFNQIKELNILENNEYQNCIYIKETKKIIDELKIKFEKYEINYQQMQKILILYNNNQDEFILRLNIFISNNNNDFAKNIIDKIKSFNQLINQIEEIMHFLKDFSYLDELKQFEELKDGLKKDTTYLSHYHQKVEEAKNLNLNKFFNLKKKLGELVKSKYFRLLYNQKEIKKYNDEEKINNLIDEFKNNWEIIFNVKKGNKSFTEKMENLIKYKKIKKTFIKFLDNDKNEIKKEINIIKDFYNSHFTKDEIDSILSELLFYFNFSGIKEQINYLLNFIEILSLKQTEISNSIKTIKNELEKDDNCIFYKVEEEIEKINEIFDLNDNNHYLEIISILMKEYAILFKFFADKNEHDIEAISEYIDPEDNPIIGVDDINDMYYLIKFLNLCLKQKESKDNDEEYLLWFKYELLEKKYNDEKDKLNNILNNLFLKIDFVQELFSKNFDSSEFSKNIIMRMLKNSTIIIKFEEDIVKCEVETIRTYKDNSQKINQRKLSKKIEDYFKIKTQILLTEKEEENNENKMKNNEYDIFLNIISELEIIIDKYEKIMNKGYFTELYYTITIIDSKLKIINNNQNEVKSLNNLRDELTEIENNQKNILKKYYFQFPYLRFLTGKQINKIYTYLKKEEKNINSILNYLLIENKDLNFNFPEKKQLTDYEYMFECVKTYLEELFQLNKPIEQLFNNYIIKKDGYKDIYSLKTDNETYEVDSLSTYYFLTKIYPSTITTLLCTNETNEEEITSFLYRSLLCKSNTLFLLINPDELNNELSEIFITNISELFEEREETKIYQSCLLTIYTKLDNELIKELKELPYHHSYVIEKNKNIIKNLDFRNKDNISIIYSAASGVGKSHTIYSNFEMNYKKKRKIFKYIYFPIGGEIKSNSVINRLKLIQESNIFLHIDIFDTVDENSKKLLRNFLFEILIFNFYTMKENIFCFKKDVIIQIEVSIGFKNIYQDFPVLKLFKSISIDDGKIDSLIISNDPKSNIQIVANYLKLIKSKKIINENIFIFIKDICEFIAEEEIKYTKIDIDYIINLQQNNNSKTEIKFFNKINAQYSKNPLKPIPKKEIINLLTEYFLDGKKDKKITFYQINSFINILAYQFKYFGANFSLTSFNLRDLGNIRLYILESLINFAKNCSKSAYEDIIQEQLIAEVEPNKINEKIEEERQNLLTKKIITFDEIINKSSIIFMNEDVNSITYIPKNNINQEEIQLMKILKSLNYDKQGIKDYNNLDNNGFLIEIQKILNLLPNYSIEQYIKKVIGHYVFTRDNFIKLLLIVLRIRAKIPIIMMGETGCGKTSLIKILADFKLNSIDNNNKNNKMFILNIHAGTGNTEIINWVKENKLLEKQENNNNKIWVFLDEINTCNSMGLISEMMFKGSIEGEKLKENITFIAACNPYRIPEKKIEPDGLVHNRSKKRNLVYTVNPLPNSLINFVFDFGNLKKEDEKKYIYEMIKEVSQKLKEKKNNINLLTELIFASHEFIREYNDRSAVSLRDCNRFTVLLEWFYNKKKKRIFENVKSEIEFNDFLYSAFLSIYICYYLRIKDKSLRKQYSKKISSIYLKGKDKWDFSTFCLLVIKKLSEHFNVEQGIAFNRVLLENIFATFVCILTKIPIFLCGKPGSSKSLSVNIVINSLIGERSKDEIFKKLPSVIKTNYQGSNTSTSEGVKDVFDRTRKKIKKELENNNNTLKHIYLIYFDEMGLAEISPNNPLKVIHSELEYDNNSDNNKIAFVGISNWTLDASKMNRGIYLSVSELDEDDLIDTAKVISKSYNTNSIDLNSKYESLFNSFSSAYLKYIDSYKNEKLYKDFHGARDFYSLIKICSKHLIEAEKEKINLNAKDIAIESIERNFGGLELSINKFKEFFSIEYGIEVKKNYPVQKCIESNIENGDNRYLLVISKSSISKYLINYILSKMKKKNIFLSGSQFHSDLINEKYSISLLNKIEILMKFGNVIVLENLEPIYPSLYDLFNQSFQIVGGKKYSKISLGSSHDVKFEVNKDLRFIILLDPEQILNQDPPFLNRFEKHIISFDYILESNENKLALNIFNKINTLSEPKDVNKNQLEVNLSKQLINFDLEEIKGLLYKYKIENNEKKELNYIECLEYILESIVPTFSQDLIVFIKNSVFYFNNEDFYDAIINIYNQANHKNLSEYIKIMKKQKNVIFTFSSVIDKLFQNDEIMKNKDLTFSLQTISKKIIDENDNEKIIDTFLKSFKSSSNQNLLIFQISIENLKHLNHIQSLLDNFIKENENSLTNKYFMIIIHLKRILPNLNITNNYLTSYNNLVSHLSDYNQIFIDNLKGTHDNITNILELSNKELFLREDLYNWEKEFDKIVYPAFSTICYEIKNQSNEIDKNNYREKATQALINNKQLKKEIQDKIIDAINKNEKSILFSVFTDKNFSYNDISFYSVLTRFMKYLHKFYFIKFIIQTEKDLMLPFLLFKKELNESQKSLKLKYLEQLNFADVKDVKDELNGNKVTSILNLGMPLYKNKFEIFNANLELYKKKKIKKKRKN